MRPEDVNAREFLILYVAARCKTVFALVKLPDFYFKCVIITLKIPSPIFNSIVARNEIEFTHDKRLDKKYFNTDFNYSIKDLTDFNYFHN